MVLNITGVWLANWSRFHSLLTCKYYWVKNAFNPHSRLCPLMFKYPSPLNTNSFLLLRHVQPFKTAMNDLSPDYFKQLGKQRKTIRSAQVRGDYGAFTWNQDELMLGIILRNSGDRNLLLLRCVITHQFCYHHEVSVSQTCSVSGLVLQYALFGYIAVSEAEVLSHQNSFHIGKVYVDWTTMS